MIPSFLFRDLISLRISTRSLASRLESGSSIRTSGRSETSTRGQRLVGEAGYLDLPFDDTKRVVDWVRNLQIPEELREQYGYMEITDEMRANFLGLNLARLAKIEPTKRV